MGENGEKSMKSFDKLRTGRSKVIEKFGKVYGKE